MTPAFSGVPNKRDKVRSGCLTPTFSRVHKRAKCYVTLAFSGVPNKGDCLTLAFGVPNKWEISTVAAPPCLLGGPKEGGCATKTLRSRRSPTKGTKSEVAASPLYAGGGGEHTRAEALRNRCVLRSPRQRGQNQKKVGLPSMQGLRNNSALLPPPKKVRVRLPLLIVSPWLGTPKNARVTQQFRPVVEPPRTQGLRSTSALLSAPAKAGVRQPLVTFVPFVGRP